MPLDSLAAHNHKVRVAILDDHQSIIDGYVYRLQNVDGIEVVGTAAFGEELEQLLAAQPVDVLLLDLNIPTSRTNSNPYPILHSIPRMLQAHPKLAILVITMHLERALVRAIMDTGVNGYLMKDDQASLRELASIVTSVSAGGIYLSPQAHQQLLGSQKSQPNLTPRQLEALALCAAYPNSSTAELSLRLGVTHSTMRNLLSGAYLRLDVRNRAAGIAKARQLGLITPMVPAGPG